LFGVFYDGKSQGSGGRGGEGVGVVKFFSKIEPALAAVDL
jgi:hypothetical protein